MTSKERFMTALNLGIPDYVPLYDFLFTQDIFEATIGKRPAGYNAEDAVNCTLKLGLDAVWIPALGFAGYTPTYLDDNTYIDEWGTTYKSNPKTAWPIDAPVAYPIKSRNDFENWKSPNPNDPHRASAIKEGIKLADNRIAILGGVLGPFTSAYFLMGLEDLCLGFYHEPELVTNIMKAANNYNITAGIKLAEAGADAIIISDDLGFDNGLFVSPEIMRKYVLPFIFEMVNEFRKHGIKVILHCDGNINDILKDIATCGICGWHPVERKAHMDLAYVKTNYGKYICPIGNVNSSTTLPFGTKEDVIKETIECIKTAGPGGGYILASDHSLHDGIPVANIFTMHETARKYGKYPLKFE